MKDLGYYNGKIGTLDELTVPFNDRVHFFGDGVYEATLARNYKINLLDEHIDRMFRSAAMVDINIRETKEEMAAILCDLVKKLDCPDQMVYWQVTRGTQVRNHTYPEDMKAYVVTVRADAAFRAGVGYFANGCRLAVGRSYQLRIADYTYTGECIALQPVTGN